MMLPNYPFEADRLASWAGRARVVCVRGPARKCTVAAAQFNR
jgi:hypothetical protein